MANLEDMMKGLAGTAGLGRDNTPLFTGQSAPVTHQAFDFWVDFDKTAADGAAATPQADTYIWTNPFDFNVVLVSARLIGLGAGIAADPTDIATITLKTDNGAGGTTAIALTWSSLTTDGNGLTSNQSKPFTVWTGANSVLVPGGNLWFNIAKGGAGKVVPISSYFLRLQKGQF